VEEERGGKRGETGGRVKRRKEMRN